MNVTSQMHFGQEASRPKHVGDGAILPPLLPRTSAELEADGSVDFSAPCQAGGGGRSSSLTSTGCVNFVRKRGERCGGGGGGGDRGGVVNAIHPPA